MKNVIFTRHIISWRIGSRLLCSTLSGESLIFSVHSRALRGCSFNRLLCEESTGEVNGPDVKLLDAVQLYFNPGGQLHDCSFEKLEELAELVYKRYMSNGAAEMALGHSPRPVDVYGPAWTANDADSGSEEGKYFMLIIITCANFSDRASRTPYGF
jgi:hypothetical protein